MEILVSQIARANQTAKVSSTHIIHLSPNSPQGMPRFIPRHPIRSFRGEGPRSEAGLSESLRFFYSWKVFSGIHENDSLCPASCHIYLIHSEEIDTPRCCLEGVFRDENAYFLRINCWINQCLLFFGEIWLL